jgi:hypothetical protein
MIQTSPRPNMLNPSTYSLQQFATIALNGFNYAIPEETLNLISQLAMKVGSPTYIKTPVFQKKIQNELPTRKKPSNHRPREEEDWGAIRSFQATKIEKKEGIDALINKIQLQLNKISETNRIEAEKNIVVLLDELLESGASEEDVHKVGDAFFHIASTNRFYSKLYADLYTNLIEKYVALKEVFQLSFNSFTGLFQKIECGDPDKNYGEYCDHVKQNEMRRALCLFFVNLSKNGVLDKELILQTLCTLMTQMCELMRTPDKKNEVNELSEIVSIIYSDELVAQSTEAHMVFGSTIKQLIVSIATSPPKTYESLASKAKFKFMDISDAMKK